MNILVCGVGVIGSLYAARLRDNGHRVTVLARGQRLADIRRYGLALENVVTSARFGITVDAIEQLHPDDQYDLALITVRRDQLASLMPQLIANRGIPTLLFMLNNPIGTAELTEVLGSRVMLGFPGAGGTRDGNVVRYAMIAQQPTMLGEPDGKRTSRLRRVVRAFRSSGFSTRTTRDMDAWLKAHAFFVTAICGAIYLSGGDCRRLSENGVVLRLMAEGVREGFVAVQALGLTVMPLALRVLFMWAPQPFVVRYWRRFFAAEMADYVFGRHARAASTEMREVANDCRILLERSRVGAPALNQLYRAIDAFAWQELHCR
jgi:2-dehydropantoate 2-reductase